jgi:hypothetical protein
MELKKNRHSNAINSSTTSDYEAELDDREHQSFLKRFQRAPIPTFQGNPDEKAQEWLWLLDDPFELFFYKYLM